MDIKKQQIRTLVSGMYDIQDLRIATGNRVVASIRPELLAAADEDREKAKKVLDNALAKIVAEYKRITDYYADVCKGKGRIDKAIAGVGATDYIKSRVDYEVVTTYTDLLRTEERMAKQVEALVEQHPMWDKFFKDVRGCGPLMAAVCLAYLDPYRAPYCSSFWKYVGVDVTYNTKTQAWEGRSRWHTEEITYTNKNGEEAKKVGLTHNPKLKTKLVGVMGGNLLKAGLRSVKDESGKKVEGSEYALSKYAQIYIDYKHRLECRPDLKDAPAWKFHKMANRYMVKMFLQDLWKVWREHEGLPTPDPYREGKLGMPPHHGNQ